MGAFLRLNGKKFTQRKVNHKMGCWGVKPFENDGAADWFGKLWDAFPVPKKVEETLRLDIQEYHQEIRAAAHVLLQFGVTYCWPVSEIDEHCELAASRLQELLDLGIYTDEEFQAQIRREIVELRSRISVPSEEDPEEEPGT